MKYILLSTDGPISLYEVPDRIAEDLTKYCVEFCDWAHNGPKAKKFRKGCFPEQKFIIYLNSIVGPNDPYKAKFIKMLGYIHEIPEQYKDLPYFNF